MQAHFEELERQRRTLPARLAAAQAARPKVIDVSDGTPRKLELGGVAPELLLDNVTDRLRDEGGDVRFTGKGDRAMVCKLLTRFEWTIHTGMTRGVNLAEAAHGGLAIDPEQYRPGLAEWLANQLRTAAKFWRSPQPILGDPLLSGGPSQEVQLEPVSLARVDV